MADELVINSENGALTSNGSTGKTWNNTWTASDGTGITLTASANNMEVISGTTNLDLRSGQAQTSTYTITVPSNYAINSYTITGKAISADQTLTPSGGSALTYTTTESSNTVTVSPAAQTTSFVLAGSNTGLSCIITLNYTVYDEETYCSLYLGSSYGEKWLRLTNVNNSSYLWYAPDTENPKTATLDMSLESQLFTFVGDNTNGFKIYCMALGEEYALTASSTSSGSYATWTSADDAALWFLNFDQVTTSGIAISTDSDASTSLNMWGGAGGYLRFYSNGSTNDGSRWTISNVNGTPLQLNFAINGPATHATNTGVGIFHLNYGSNSSTSAIFTSDSGASKSYYLPADAEVTCTGVGRHGWSYDGTSVADGVTTVSFSAVETDYQTLAYSPSGVQIYRIPAIAQNNEGELVAIYDYRVCHNDVGFGEVDQVMRISSDNGATWSEETKIADGNSTGQMSGNVFGLAYGDPALCLDRESGAGVLITVSGQQPYPYATASSRPFVAMQQTTDGGHTWSDPADITSQFWGTSSSLFQDSYYDGWGDVFAYSGFFGSGKILQSRLVKKGDYYRIYAAMLVRGTGLAGAYVVYSDDMGATWNVLGGDPTVQACSGSDEPKVEELADGSIVLSCRMWGGRYFNIWTYDDSSYSTGTWGTYVDSASQTGGIKASSNSCNGEILILDAYEVATGNATQIALQSIPFGSGRANVGLYYKVLDSSATYTPTTFASDWVKSTQVSTLASAYSTMCLQADKRIAFFYEEFITGGGTYDMIYLPLLMEDLTGGLYTLHERGDVNLDGMVDVNDVTALVDIILGTWGTKRHGVTDINADESVDVNDVTALVDIILGN